MDNIIKKFQTGTNPLHIVSNIHIDHLYKPTTISDDYLQKQCIKFIPSSGAATRLFEDLYVFVNTGQKNKEVKRFFSELQRFPFLQDINNVVNIKNASEKDIASSLLYSPLHYGSLPKALIKVHSYEEHSTTPIEEHIIEGVRYLPNSELHFHFTISSEHENVFSSYIKSMINRYPKIKITYSFQKEKTDTLAVTLDNKPFIMHDGKALYRPGGHGSLIENVNDLHADIIFIKNIDNVCHTDHIKDTVESKKHLASAGLEVKKQIDNFLVQLDNNSYDLDKINEFLSKILNINYKNTLTKEKARQFLDRPLRVCGVVKNTGEPGGGPFFVDNGDYSDIQICEKSEIDLHNSSYKEIYQHSTYFNPVDLVCFVKDYKNNHFNLLNYINEDRYFISTKTYQGQTIKALEHPGLWNGAMHNWNSLYVEVPLSTFNPIKSINDLLRSGHQPSK